MPKILLDETFVSEAVARMAGLAPDAKPLWGSMVAEQMFAHLTTAFRYSLGKEALTPDEGGFFGHVVAARMILNRIMKIPKNKRAPKMYNSQAPRGDTDTLKTEAMAFLAGQADGTLKCPPHPYFGEFGVAGWSLLHRIHMEHHMRQFGLID